MLVYSDGLVLEWEHKDVGGFHRWWFVVDYNEVGHGKWECIYGGLKFGDFWSMGCFERVLLID